MTIEGRTDQGGYIVTIEQVRRSGPVLIKEDLAGRSVLRQSSYYISSFREYGMDLVGQYSTHNGFLWGLFQRIRDGLAVRRHRRIDYCLLRAAIWMNTILDILYMKDIKRDGHHLFYFRKIAR